MLRPAGEPVTPARRSIVIDVLLAVALTALALIAAVNFPGGNHDDHGSPQPLAGVLRLRPDGPGNGTVSTAPPSHEIGAPVEDSSEPTWPKVYEPPAILVVLTALPLALRRRFPLAVFWTVLTAALVTYAGATWITVLACAVAAYSAVAHSRNRMAAVAGLLLPRQDPARTRVRS
ncbi:hypothetical protein ACFQ08_18800 [Streptosporangium algeriense]|uniref:DUF7134 domain-containing protein n=1 Tax=Streptosporangium algeriense TaxID=1682748 RepID=A0ABW3DRZ3_9ACTN